MIKYLLLLTLFSTIYLKADCSSYYLLGSKQQTFDKTITTKNSIVLQYSKNEWSASQPKDEVNLSKIDCKDRGYVLINDNNISYSTDTYNKKYYDIKKGWNYISSQKNGLDVEKTFARYKDVEFVYIYDKKSEVWAGYSSDEELNTMMNTTRIAYLKSIEAGLGFYVYAKTDIKVDIKSIELSNVCSEKLKSKEFNSILDTGLDDYFVYNSEKTVGVKSRYFSHHKRGIYDDTRVLLIYPELKVKTKRDYKYGPAKPKMHLEFAKEYEGQKFYVYDYKEKKCFKGIFPSLKIPPFATLKEI